LPRQLAEAGIVLLMAHDLRRKIAVKGVLAAAESFVIVGLAQQLCRTAHA